MAAETVAQMFTYFSLCIDLVCSLSCWVKPVLVAGIK